MDLIFRAVEDADLIRQAAEGTVAAYNLLVSRWEKRIYNYLLRITRHREEAMQPEDSRSNGRSVQCRGSAD
jgi:RNA polymerase sigma-70 factor, ECF subfamily